MTCCTLIIVDVIIVNTFFCGGTNLNHISPKLLALWCRSLL